jgi:hypothetical protein
VSDGPFQVWREESGDLWCSPGHAIGIHSAATVVFQTPNVAAVGITVPRAAGSATPLQSPRGQKLAGGSGRNWKISGGPADPLFPTGVFKPAEPGLWDNPEYGLATLTEAGDGSLSLHDGTAEVATASGAGLVSGSANAGTFPSHDFGYDSDLGAWLATTDSDTRVSFYSGNGRLSDGSGFIVASRTGILDSPLDPSGVYVATTYGKDTYNGGAAWSYTVTAPGGPATMNATTYGEDTYNGGSPFSFAAEFEGDLTGVAAIVAVDSGTAQQGRYPWTAWQAWASEDDPDWTISIDALGEGSILDGATVIATRGADASKLYDPSGVYPSTPAGAAAHGDSEDTTAGTASAGTLADQDFAEFGTVGTIETWNGAADPSKFIELDTVTGDATLYDGLAAVATRPGGSTASIDGVYDSTDHGAATYHTGSAFTYTVATTSAGAAFTVTVGTASKPTQAGYVYVVLTIDGSNELTGVSAPAFAATLPANTSTAKTIPIAYSDGAGLPVQIQAGPIIWRA